jgi:hypothetical protein
VEIVAETLVSLGVVVPWQTSSLEVNLLGHFTSSYFISVNHHVSTLVNRSDCHRMPGGWSLLRRLKSPQPDAVRSTCHQQ